MNEQTIARAINWRLFNHLLINDLDVEVFVILNQHFVLGLKTVNCFFIGRRSTNAVQQYVYMQILYYSFCMTDIVTLRVNESLKKKIKKYKISVSKIIREALEEEIKKKERQELVSAITEMKTILQKIPDEEIIRAVRESRDQRRNTSLTQVHFCS